VAPATEGDGEIRLLVVGGGDLPRGDHGVHHLPGEALRRGPRPTEHPHERGGYRSPPGARVPGTTHEDVRSSSVREINSPAPWSRSSDRSPRPDPLARPSSMSAVIGPSWKRSVIAHLMTQVTDPSL